MVAVSARVWRPSVGRLGAALMAVGHFMMAFEPLFLLALFTLILGNGAFRPNISTQVGGLYAPGDHRRDRAYSIFYVGINVGAFLAPLVCGTLGEELGWHYGFAAVGTFGSGLARLVVDRRWQSYTTANTKGGLPDGIQALAHGADGALWIGTGSGLTRLDKKGRWR